MWRILALACLFLAGCDSGSSLVPNPEANGPDKPVVSVPAIPSAINESLNSVSAEWPKVTEEPFLVERAVSMMCISNAASQHGPHYAPAIVVRTNPEALDAFRARQSPMPVGTIVLKEKHELESASDPPNEFGAMIKREPGYDPENGDWEYVYGTISPKVSVERGKLANCIACHSAYAKEHDFLFRSYLPSNE